MSIDISVWKMVKLWSGIRLSLEIPLPLHHVQPCHCSLLLPHLWLWTKTIVQELRCVNHHAEESQHVGEFVIENLSTSDACSWELSVGNGCDRSFHLFLLMHFPFACYALILLLSSYCRLTFQLSTFSFRWKLVSYM